jgi:hypothetical protein
MRGWAGKVTLDAAADGLGIAAGAAGDLPHLAARNPSHADADHHPRDPPAVTLESGTVPGERRVINTYT